MSKREEIEAAKDALVRAVRVQPGRSMLLNRRLRELDSLTLHLPSDETLRDWEWEAWPTGAQPVMRGSLVFMARCLRWRIDNPDVDLVDAAAELESRHGGRTP